MSSVTATAAATSRVAPTQGQQFIVPTALDDTAGVHHQNLVRVGDGREAVRDDQHWSCLADGLSSA